MASARATRNTRVASMRATVTINTPKLEPSPEITISAIMMAGNEMSASTTRLRTVSTHPLRTAARNPVAHPIRKASAEIPSAKLKVTRAPYMRRDARSRPRKSPPDKQSVAGRHEAVIGEDRALVVGRQPRRGEADCCGTHQDAEASAGGDRELRSKLAEGMGARLRCPGHFGNLSLGLATMAITSASRFRTT